MERPEDSQSQERVFVGVFALVAGRRTTSRRISGTFALPARCKIPLKTFQRIKHEGECRRVCNAKFPQKKRANRFAGKVGQIGGDAFQASNIFGNEAEF